MKERSQTERRSNITEKLQSQDVQIFGYVFHDTSGPDLGQTLKILWFLSKKKLYGHKLAGLLWERQLEKVRLG